LKRKEKDERRIISRNSVLKNHDCSAYNCWVRVAEDLMLLLSHHAYNGAALGRLLFGVRA
jgi:hypothetical protein